jgi:sulfonate transport system substrate-binding protein
MQLGRRSLIAAASTAALPRFAIAQSMPELQTMRSTSRSWLWMGEDYANIGGFFTKAGVKVVSNASNRGTNVAALAGGGVDLVLGDPGEVLNALGQNFGVRSLVQTVDRYGSHVMMTKTALAKAGVTEASPPEAKYKALKGMRMGTTGPGAAPDTLLRWMAVRAGLDPNKDIKLVPVQGGGPGMIAGLQQGVIDGFCLSSPTADLAVAKAGCGYLFNMVTSPPPQLKNFCYIIASTSDKTLHDKREALIRYATGVALALRSIKQEPDKFKAAAIPFLQLDPSIAEGAFAGNATMYTADPMPVASEFPLNIEMINIADESGHAPKVPASVTFQKMYDTSIVAEAMKRI